MLSVKKMESESKLSLEAFEEIVVCPIHLGMLEDGRFLPCGHAFCRSCIDACLKKGLESNSEVFICPNCRHPCDLIQGAVSLPKACQLNQVVEQILDRKNTQLRRTKSEDPADHPFQVDSMPEKVGCSSTTTEDINPNLLHPFYTSAPAIPMKSLGAIGNVYSCNSIHSRLTTTTEYEMIDQETVKENMRRHSRYNIKYHISTKVVHTNALNSLSSITSCASNSSHNLPADIICADVFDNPNLSFDVLMIDRLRGNLLVRGNGEVSKQSIPIMVDSFKFQPIHLKLYDKYLFMSGQVDCEHPYCLIVKCTMEGHVIGQSERFPVDNSRVLPINGFCIDEEAGEIIVAMSASMKICIFDTNLNDSGAFYGLESENTHPYYIIRKQDTKELWITCPLEGRILILNEESGAVSKFGTREIYNAIPSAIVLTTDDRILFMDSNDNRIFWITKRNEYILIQTLKFRPSLHSSGLRSLTALSDNRLLVSTNDCVFIAKPVREISGSSSNWSCAIL